MRGIAVVDQPVEDRVAVWHVNVGDGLESTMAGAWVLPSDDDRISGLLGGRLLVSTEKGSGRFGAGADAAPLAAAIMTEIEGLDTAYASHVASLPSSRRSLVRLLLSFGGENARELAPGWPAGDKKEKAA